MKFVVTGALGHIGSRLIRQLPLHWPDGEFVLVDNLSTLRYCSLFDLPQEANYRFVETDVLTTNLAPLLEGDDVVVVHLAAITDAASSFENRDQVEHVNFNATKQVASACEQTGAKMIFISSTSVYGTQSDVVDENCTLDELKPQSPYAETKLREERFLGELSQTTDFRFVTCRFGTICGTSPGMRFHTAVNKFCWQAVLEQPISVWRTALHQRRPYLDLHDAVRGLVHIANKDLFSCDVYNVLTDNLTVDDILQSIKTVILDPTVEFVDSAVMNQLSYHVANQKFRDTGFQFEGSVRRAIQETIRMISASNGGAEHLRALRKSA